MSKTLTPEPRDIFHQNGLNYSQLTDGDKTSDTYVSMGLDGFNTALQQLNTYYLNLFMECLGEEEEVLKISSAHELYSGAVDADSYRRGFRTAQSMALNNLKNKLGVDKD